MQDKKGLRGSGWVQTKNGAKNGVNEGEERGGEEQGQVHFLPRSRNRSRPDPACTTPFVPRWKRHSGPCFGGAITAARLRSEEHTSELQSLMRTSYAVFCFKKKIIKIQISLKHILRDILFIRFIRHQQR